MVSITLREAVQLWLKVWVAVIVSNHGLNALSWLPLRSMSSLTEPVGSRLQRREIPTTDPRAIRKDCRVLARSAGQRRHGGFRLGKPEGHPHGAVEGNGGGQLGTGLLPLGGFDVEGAEAGMAVGSERAHAEFVGEGEGPLVVGCGLVEVRGISKRRNVAE